jgi:hypothetical protein
VVVSVGVGVWSLTKDSFAKIKIRGQSCSGAGFDDDAGWVTCIGCAYISVIALVSNSG